MMGDSVNQSAPQLTPYDEDDSEGSPVDYGYDDDAQPYPDEKTTRYGRGITESPPRGRAGSGGSSGSVGLGIRDAHEDTPPRPPTHGGRPGTPGNGSGAGGNATPGSGTRTPRGAFL